MTVLTCLLILIKTKGVKAESFVNSTNNQLQHNVFLADPQTFDISLDYDLTIHQFRVSQSQVYNPIRVFFNYDQLVDTSSSVRNQPNVFKVRAFLCGATSDNLTFSTPFSFDTYGNNVNLNLASLGQSLEFIRWRLERTQLNNRPALNLIFEIYGKNLGSSTNSIELLHTLYGRSYFDYYTAESRNTFLNNYRYYESWSGLYATGAYQGTYEEGYDAGVHTSQEKSYHQGLLDGQATSYGNTGINQIIQTVVQSPISFVQQVFNTEIFGYNISGIIFAIISLGLTIFIVKLIFTFIGK